MHKIIKYGIILIFIGITTACSAVDLLNNTVSTAQETIKTNLPYGQTPKQILDVYQPLTPGPHPIVVFYYGGAWQMGSKNDYLFVATALAKQGIVVIVPDYRVYPEVTYPGFLEDAAQALAWAKTHGTEYGGNPKHLFVMGHSSGAYLSIMLALNSHYLEAVGLQQSDLAGAIGISGPYNFLPLTRQDIKPIFEVVPDLSVTQPITFADGKNPPLLLLTGDSDTTVEPHNTRDLVKRIQEKGGPIDARYYPGVDHIDIVAAFAPLFEDRAPTLADVTAFIKTH